MNVIMKDLLILKDTCELIKKEKINIKTSYKIVKLLEILSKEEEFYQNNFVDILKECGKKDDDGNLIFTEDGQSVKLCEDKIDEAGRRLADLQDIEVNIPDNIKFTLEELETLSISAEQLMPLMILIEN